MTTLGSDDGVKFDDYDWHAGNLPDDLPFEQGFVHIGVYLAWLLENDLLAVDREILSYPATAKELEAIRRRSVTGSVLNDHLDGKLTSDLMTDEGDAFTRYYYDRYLGDYAGVMTRVYPTAYHAADSWDTYDRMSPVIDRAWSAWVAVGRPAPRTSSLSRWATSIPEGTLIWGLIGGIIGGVALTAIRPPSMPAWVPLAVGLVIAAASFVLSWLRTPD